MKRLALNNKILEKIKSDQELNGIVAKSIGVSTLSMPRLLNTNNPKLTQASALLAIREYLDVQDKDILCTVHKKSQKLQTC
jgi:DNA-binding Xre family transcriptional regulator